MAETVKPEPTGHSLVHFLKRHRKVFLDSNYDYYFKKSSKQVKSCHLNILKRIFILADIFLTF